MSTTFQETIPQAKPLMNITGSLLRTAVIEQAAAKVGIFGPQGSGKTLTSALIALGLSKTYHNSAPVAFMDTENGSDYLVPIFEAEGVPLLNFKSRAFKDMCQGLKDAAASGCCAYLVDSYTHPWRELNDSLKAKLKVQKLEFRHMDQLKGIWMGWTDLMLNSQQHVIVSGRLGYVWDREEEEDGKKGDLIKLGTKMKSESEAGYEPSLLIEMEGVQDSDLRMKKSRAKRGTITHHAYVLKDRWRTLNGISFAWKDLNGYDIGDYKTVFNSFLPHFSKLVIGQKQQAVNGRNSEALFDGQGEGASYRRQKEIAIALEIIEGTLLKFWPGTTAIEKELKRLAVETVFNTRSWTAVTNKPLAELQFGIGVLQGFEQHVVNGHDALTDKAAAVALLELCKDSVLADLAAEEFSGAMNAVPV